jgi:hypothetical protein
LKESCMSLCFWNFCECKRIRWGVVHLANWFGLASAGSSDDVRAPRAHGR